MSVSTSIYAFKSSIVRLLGKSIAKISLVAMLVIVIFNIRWSQETGVVWGVDIIDTYCNAKLPLPHD